jgi:S-adenosylmethionine hydrolase
MSPRVTPQFLFTSGGVQLVPGKIEGKVTSYSEAGNLVTDIAVDRLRSVPRDQSVSVTCDEHQTVGLFTPEHQEPEMTLLALLAPSGFLELVIVGDSAKIMLGVRVGQAVTVQW